MRWARHVARMKAEKYTQDIGGKARKRETTKKTKT
jgi:hypothetical protein